MEDSFIAAIRRPPKRPVRRPAAWAPVLEKLAAGGTLSGAKAATTAEQFLGQMQTAMRDSRAAGLKAAQTLAESYAALVSGVLIGMSDALTQGQRRRPRRKKK